ncbi:hypothetical protein PAXRUDRAFT_808047, partial [Paxillus rubicundulus Ve08.2h10]
KIWFKRSGLMVSDELPSILKHWYKPPRTTGSMSKQAQGARPTLEHFAFLCFGDVVEAELDGIKDTRHCPAEDLSMEGLTSLFIEDLLLKLSSPGFEKIPDLVLYSRSHHNNHFAKMITLFLCSQGTPAKSIDLLCAFGLTMSHQWSVCALRTIPENGMATVQDMVQHLPFVVTHDNIDIPFHVFSQ